MGKKEKIYCNFFFFFFGVLGIRNLITYDLCHYISHTFASKTTITLLGNIVSCRNYVHANFSARCLLSDAFIERWQNGKFLLGYVIIRWACIHRETIYSMINIIILRREEYCVDYINQGNSHNFSDPWVYIRPCLLTYVLICVEH